MIIDDISTQTSDDSIADNNDNKYSTQEDEIDDIYAPLDAFNKISSTNYSEAINEIKDDNKDNNFDTFEDFTDDASTETKSFDKESDLNIDELKKEKQNNTETLPQGLFSPASGLGWEEYLVDRLNSEISRAAQNEQDLALVIYRLKFLRRTDGLFRKIISKSIELFNYKDLIFEYGSDGIAIIVNNTTFDKIMQRCEELHKNIFDLFTENEYKNEVGIGISLRASRLISADRLITEAKNACEKAIMEKDLPIVAFRADPERYRNYLTNETI